MRIPLLDVPVPLLLGGSVRRVANSGRRVLVVDDNVDAAHSLAEIVAMFGHSAEAGFDAHVAKPPDIDALARLLA